MALPKGVFEHTRVSTNLSVEDLEARIRSEKIRAENCRRQIRRVNDSINAAIIQEEAKSAESEFISKDDEEMHTSGKSRSGVAGGEEFAMRGNSKGSIASLSDYEIKSFIQRQLVHEINAVQERGNNRRYFSSAKGENTNGALGNLKIEIGETVIHDMKGIATVRYIGPVPTLGPGTWFGLELHSKKLVSVGSGSGRQWLGQGVGDGSLLEDGVRKSYFNCDPGLAIFVRREHLSDAKTARTVIASSHRMRTEKVCVRLGGVESSTMQLSGDLAESNVLCLSVPEDCTFERFQNNLIDIVSGDQGTMQVQVWGHPVRLSDKKSSAAASIDDSSSKASKTWEGTNRSADTSTMRGKERTGALGKSISNFDDSLAATKVVESIDVGNGVTEASFVPQVIPHKPEDRVCEFLRSIRKPKGIYSSWNDPQSNLPTVAFVVRRTELSRARFWLEHPAHLRRFIEWIAADGDENAKSSTRELNFEQFRLLMLVLRSKTSRVVTSIGADDDKARKDDVPHWRTSATNASQFATDSLIRRFVSVERLRADLAAVDEKRELFEDYHLFRSFGYSSSGRRSGKNHRRMVDDESSDDVDSDDEDDEAADATFMRGMEIADGQARGAFESGKVENDLVAVEDEDVLEMYLHSIKDPTLRKRTSERLKGVLAERMQLRGALHRLSPSKSEDSTREDISLRREERVEHWRMDFSRFSRLLRLWTRNEDKIRTRINLPQFYKTIQLSLDDRMQFKQFLLGLKSISSEVVDRGARIIFKKVDFKKRGFVTFQQMDEYWDIISDALKDRNSVLYKGMRQEKSNLDVPSFMRSKDSDHTKVYSPLSADKKHTTRKLCWMFLLLILWCISLGFFSEQVQSSYEFQRAVRNVFVGNQFLDTTQTSLFSGNIRIDMSKIATVNQTNDFLSQVVAQVYEIGSSSPIADENVNFLRTMDQAFGDSIIFVGPMTMRQMRVNPSENCDTDQIYQSNQACVGTYTRSIRRVPFGPSGNGSAVSTSGVNCTSSNLNINDFTLCAVAEGWDFYDPANNDEGYVLSGIASDDYDFSGYRISFDPYSTIGYNFTYAFDILQDSNNKWFDDYSAALIIHFPLYNTNIGVFEDLWLILEWSPFGAIFPSSQLVNAFGSDQLSSSSDKALVAVYVWSAIVHIFSLRRLVKRWKYADGGFAFLDVTHFALFFLGLCFHFAIFVDADVRDIQSFSSVQEVYSAIASDEQIIVRVGSIESYVKAVEVSMVAIVTITCIYAIVLLSRRSTVAVIARSLSGSNFCDITLYYGLFLVIILLIALINEGLLQGHVSVFSDSARAFQRVLGYTITGIDYSETRELFDAGVPSAYINISTFTCVALLLLKLFIFPVFRASVAQFYMQSIFKMRHKERRNNSKHGILQYFQALVDLFPKESSNRASTGSITRKLREALSSNEGKRTAQSDASNGESPIEKEKGD